MLENTFQSFNMEVYEKFIWPTIEIFPYFLFKKL